ASKIKSKDIAKNAVTKKKIKKKAVTSKRLRDDSVTNSKLAAGAVSTDKLADSAVTGPKVQDGSLSPAKVAQAVTTVTLSTGLLAPGGCHTDQVTVPGMQAGDSVLAYPEGVATTWTSGMVLDAYGPTATADQLTVRVCNPTASGIVPAPLPIQVLL